MFTSTKTKEIAILFKKNHQKINKKKIYENYNERDLANNHRVQWSIPMFLGLKPYQQSYDAGRENKPFWYFYLKGF